MLAVAYQMQAHMKKYKEQAVIMDCGDDSVGTAFFTLYEYIKTAEYLNLVSGLFEDVLSWQKLHWIFGNHEFDLGEKKLSEAVAKFKFHVYGSNLDFSTIKADDPKNLQKVIEADETRKRLQGATYDMRDGKPSWNYIPQQNLMVMGVTTTDTPIMVESAKTTFNNEIETVKKALKLSQAREHKWRVAVMTHQGYRKDLEMARAVPGSFIIVGGHSHTGLGNSK